MDLPSLYAIGAFIQALRPEPRAGGGAAGARHRGPRLHRHRPRQHRQRSTTAPSRSPGAAAVGPLLGRAATAPCASTSPRTAATRSRASAGAGRGRRRYADPEDARRGRGTPGGTTGPTARPSSRSTCAELAEIEKTERPGHVESGKVHVIKEKRTPLRGKLQKQWGAPDAAVEVGVGQRASGTSTTRRRRRSRCSGKITGLAFAPVAACSTFGVGAEAGDGRHPARRGQGGGGRAPPIRRRTRCRGRLLSAPA